MAFGRASWTISALMIASGTSVRETMSSEVFAFQIDSPRKLLLAGYLDIARLSISIVECHALVLHSMFVKRRNSHRFNIFGYPLALIRLQFNSSGFSDAVPFIVEQDVLARVGTHPQENTIIPSLVFKVLLRPMLVTALFSKTQQSTIERPQPDSFIWRFPIGTTMSIS